MVHDGRNRSDVYNPIKLRMRCRVLILIEGLIRSLEVSSRSSMDFPVWAITEDPIVDGDSDERPEPESYKLFMSLLDGSEGRSLWLLVHKRRGELLRRRADSP